ncbi:MAG: hypothetical protein IJP92_14615 [Lachnospiraceae bacterium]|nr:hypothetical protein [Lachnospiraceae bacterium]
MAESSAMTMATKSFGVITALTIATMSPGLTMQTYASNNISDPYVYNGPYMFTDYQGDMSSSLPLYDGFASSNYDHSVNSIVKEHKSVQVKLHITKISRYIPTLEIDEDIVEI